MAERQIRYVEVLGNRLGHLINKPQESFPLRNLFGQELGKYLGGDKFYKAYLRTYSDNIYMLDEGGILVNRNASIERGKLSVLQLDTQSLMDEDLEVGKIFRYRQGYTTPIEEIVPVTRRMYAPGYLETLTYARRSSIIEEFLYNLPRS